MNYKVNFKDCKFGEFEPHYEIEYNGKKYRAIDINVEHNGYTETQTISENKLEDELFKHGEEIGVVDEEYDTFDLNSEESQIDDDISFYADVNDSIYFILEHIYG